MPICLFGLYVCVYKCMYAYVCVCVVNVCVYNCVCMCGVNVCVYNCMCEYACV